MANELEKKEVIYVCNPQINTEDDEIDLRELCKTMWKHKKFIIIFTLAITLLAGIYVFFKTPIYQIKSDIQVGQIDGKSIISSKNIEEYTKALYKQEIQKKFKKIPNAYLCNITTPKKTNTFLTLTIDGLSNKYDLIKKNEILTTIQNTYNFKIKKFLVTKENQLQNLNTQLKSIDLEKSKNIKDKIKQTQTQILINKNIVKYYNQKIKTNNNKISFLNQEIKKIPQYLNQLVKANNNNNNNTPSNLIISTNILNYQNMLKNLYNQVENLQLEKTNIISQILPNLQKQIQKLQNQIQKLQITLKIQIPQEKQNIKSQINLVKLQIQNTFFTKEIGNPLINNYPVKPKKKLIIVVAFITGFILAIFLVFFIEFIKDIKEEKPKLK